MVNKKLLYLPTVGLALLCSVSVAFFQSLLNQWFEEETIKDLQSALQSSIIGIEREEPIFHPAFMDSYVDANPAASDHLRISVIDHEGTVIGDSLLSVVKLPTLDNQSNRPEVAEANKKGVSISLRYSDTLEADMIYVARSFSYGEFSGVMRFGTPMNYIRNFVDEVTTLLSTLMGMIIVGMWLIAYFTNRQIEHHLEREQSHLEDHVQSRTREIELLQRLANMLAACNSLREAQEVVEDIVPRILGKVNGAISLIRSSRNQLEIKLDWGDEWPGVKQYAPSECWALRKGKYHLACDNYTSLPCMHMTDVGDDQTLCIPLIAHGNTIGLMHIYIGDDQTIVNDEFMQLAFTVGEHLGLALANLNLQEKLREQAVRDPLTGLHNRRYFEETISHELMRAKRHDQPLSILMLDMDHFKHFNDTFGHDAGDYVLKSLATLLGQHTRARKIRSAVLVVKNLPFCYPILTRKAH